ncbi:exopolysaccharide biosynthesis polyprenyl glycosylphosphotransferase [Rubrobacter radiotolerans]|uniref:Exopolysaccharide biosynthesis polyprenyl glycosylphosphotransferase n=2 Tax=Rubrobacter radiotolerans TaxID=42256 RepID=A0A023WZT3_RUBRA|nr:exopolysaccharide biosynthesis polyprenyl glycosylphosphotransferase [Rubrobacter radiotolerans]AHY45742.1 exopolysaccharide biosynthesis polyprenyl glycosylphosphotransferase [Rubrobacter radiotolerans]MDX5893159.1 exopolysaccharide biosynthesis polyprenyl glycosylphosphotransferase [Rubrobacter radiotolerans]
MAGRFPSGDPEALKRTGRSTAGESLAGRVVGRLFSGTAASRLFGRATIMTADALAFLGSLALAVTLVPGGTVVGGVLSLAPLLLVVWFAVLSAHNLYGWVPPERRSIGSLVAALLWCVAILAVGSLLYPESGFVAAEVVLAGALVVGSGLVVHRTYVRGVALIYRSGLGRIPTVVLGPPEERERVKRLLAGGAYAYAGGMSPGERCLVRLRHLLEATGARSVVLSDGADLAAGELGELLRSMRLRGVRVMAAPAGPSLVESGTLVPGGEGLFEVRPPLSGEAGRYAKRSLDVALSLSMLALLLPALVAISAVIRTQSPGPALFRQLRAGADGVPFVCYKFRSMYADAGERQAALERSNEARGAFFKMRRDPRVTPVGRFLRRWSLDELPQLLNVLKGEMSLVGPRPLPLRDCRRMSEREKRRLAAVPGLTGLWQISGRSDLPFEEMLRLDLHYIENWSLALDASILLRTVWAVFHGRGAY